MTKRACVVGLVGLFVLAGCSSSEPPPAPSTLASSPQALTLLASLRSRFVLPPVALPQRPEGLPSDASEPEPRTLFPHGSSEGFDRSGDRLVPRLRIASSVRRPATVTLPVRADGGFEVRDTTSGLRLGVKLRGTTSVEAEEAEGNVVYRGGYRGQGAVVHRPHAEGTEDFVLLEHEPEDHALVYEVDVRGVAGLRLTSNVLEFLNEGGDPRLRMTAPLAVDAAGKALGLRVSVKGCVVDEKEALPWGREVVRPGAERCEVRVEWGAGAEYPLMVDPAFTTTGSLAVGRSYHTASVLSGDRVLVVGGSNSGDETNCPGGYCKLAEVWQNGSFANAGSLAVGRFGNTVTLLSGDRVLVVGGSKGGDAANCPGSYCKLAEVWQNGSFANAGSLAVGRYLHTASVLSADRVLVVGGSNSGDAANCPGSYCKLAEVWQNGSFANAGSLAVGRSGNTVTLLSGDRVLVVGGQSNDATNCPNNICKLAEVWQNGSFANAGSLAVGRYLHTASVLSADRVLVVGGSNSGDAANCPNNICKLAEVWQNGSFANAGSLAVGRYNSTTHVLSDGSVLVLGGASPICSGTLCDTAEKWSNGSFSAAGKLLFPRQSHSSTLLPDGRVLVIGGSGLQSLCGSSCAVAEQWANGIFSAGGGLANPRSNHTASLLSDGGVLVIGGFCSGGYCKSTEKWDPSLPTVGMPCDNSNACTSGTVCSEGVCCDKNCAGIGSCLASKNGKTQGICSPLKLGIGCSNSVSCDSGVCSIEGKCCDKLCDGICESCTAFYKGYGVDGVCEPIKANTDPQQECTVQGGGICQSTGFCDGTKAACESKLGTTCLPSSCSNATTQLNASVCDATGNCVSNGTSSCSPYACKGSGCLSSCSDNSDCAPGIACVNSKCAAPQALGTACSLDAQCQSGFCVKEPGQASGVCCDNACDGPCLSCLGLNKADGTPSGTCGAVKPDTDPKNLCPSDSSNSCGADGKCDASGSCRAYAKNGSTCGATSCTANGTSVVGKVCDGNGLCIDASNPVPCGNYKCAAGTCSSSCSTAADCTAGLVCVGQACVVPLAKGQACSDNGQCQSGFCVKEPSDAPAGVCCDQLCDGPCSSCLAELKGGGNTGECGFVLTGTDPKDKCSTDPNNPCGASGFCAADGKCQALAPASTSCGASTCTADGLGVSGKLCNGQGVCAEGQQASCGDYRCQEGKCLIACTTKNDCAGGKICVGGQCQTPLENGKKCGGDEECQSGYCVEQTCCSEACDGECVSCVGSKTGKDSGTCAPVLEGTDPKGKCEPGTSGSVCPADGLCDGKGQCRQVAKEGTACGATTCVGSSVAGSVCDAQGKCVKSEGVSCGAYACQGDKCAVSCTTKNDCAENFRCEGGVCVKLKELGSPCSDGSECSKGFCSMAEGVCCDSPCLDACSTCTAIGKLGTCSVVPANQSPPAGKSCPGEGACAAFCDGTSPSCSKPSAGTSCAPASCSGNVLQGSGTCDNAGLCVVPDPKPCDGNFACNESSGSCKTSCSSDGDCAAGATCNKATGQCSLGEASCADDFTAKTASGTLVPCKGRCLAGQCQETCSGPADCAKGHSCLNNTCVADSGSGGQGGVGGQGGSAGASAGGTGGAPASPLAAASDDGGCGCSTPGQRTHAHGAAWLLALALAFSRRRRSRATFVCQ